MATKDKTSGTEFFMPADGLNQVFTMKTTVDISDAENADVYQVLRVKDGICVLGVFTKIVTPNNAATSSAFDIGDGDSATGYDASVDAKAVAGTRTKSIGGTDTYATQEGKLYTADDTIDLTFAVTGTNTAGEVEVTALCVDVR